MNTTVIVVWKDGTEETIDNVVSFYAPNTKAVMELRRDLEQIIIPYDNVRMVKVRLQEGGGIDDDGSGKPIEDEGGRGLPPHPRQHGEAVVR
jgi:hypothetical protein